MSLPVDETHSTRSHDFPDNWSLDRQMLSRWWPVLLIEDRYTVLES
jgi:hypothetical protein